MQNINIHCPLVLRSRGSLSRSKSEIGNILLHILQTIAHNLRSGPFRVSEIWTLGRGDGTLVPLTYIHSSKQLLNYLRIHSLPRSRDPKIELQPLSLKEHASPSIFVAAASLRASCGESGVFSGRHPSVITLINVLSLRCLTSQDYRPNPKFPYGSDLAQRC